MLCTSHLAVDKAFPGEPGAPPSACLGGGALTFRQQAHGLVGSVPAGPPLLPGSGALPGLTGAPQGRGTPLGGRGAHRFPLDLLPGSLKSRAAACPAVEGQGQQEPLGWIQYPLAGRTERQG